MSKKTRKMTVMSCVALILCLAVSGCGGKGGEEDREDPVVGLEPVELDRESQDGADTPQSDGASGAEGTEQAPGSAGASTQAPAQAPDSGPEDTSTEESASGGGEAAQDAPEIRFEIQREAKTDDGGAEMVFSEYPMFTVAGEGSAYAGLSAALTAINEQYRSDNQTTLDELQESLKDYRESIDPAAVFGQGANVYIYRCDADVVSIMVMRTVNMGGPHPNNYWDYYNLNAKTGDDLQLSQFLTMDETTVEDIIEQLHDNYPEAEFDDGVLRAEIPELAAGEGIGWYFFEGQISLSFPEGAFGFGHAVGSLGVTISLD